MTKIKITNAPSGKQLMENIEYSPYYNVAVAMINKKGIQDPTIADLFECFHEIAKIDHKINNTGE